MWGWWKIGRFGYMADYINNNSTQLVIDRLYCAFFRL
jgi:hypothetical protein